MRIERRFVLVGVRPCDRDCCRLWAALDLAFKQGHEGAMRLLLDAGAVLCCWDYRGTLLIRGGECVVEGAITPADWCPCQDLGGCREMKGM